MAGKIVYRAIETAFAVSTTFVVRKALKAAWQRTRGAEPPTDPTAPDTDWKDAIAWAAASAAGITVGQMVASWGTTKTYQSLTGQERPQKKSKRRRLRH